MASTRLFRPRFHPMPILEGKCGVTPPLPGGIGGGRHRRFLNQTSQISTSFGWDCGGALPRSGSRLIFGIFSRWANGNLPHRGTRITLAGFEPWVCRPVQNRANALCHHGPQPESSIQSVLAIHLSWRNEWALDYTVVPPFWHI